MHVNADITQQDVLVVRHPPQPTHGRASVWQGCFGSSRCNLTSTQVPHTFSMHSPKHVLAFCRLVPRRRATLLTSRCSHFAVILKTATRASFLQPKLSERPGQCLQGQETTNIYQHPPWSDSFVLQILPLEVTALRGQSFCAVRMSIRERLTSFGLEHALKTRRNGLTKGFTTGGFQQSPGAGPDFTALL